MITQQELKELLDYNPETGVFTWKVPTAQCVKVGDVAGFKKHGYIIISVKGKRHRAHRLSMLYVHGLCVEVIDHINGIKDDNRIENLRAVTPRQNTQNRKEHREGKLVGTSYNKRAKKWMARIYINGRYKYLGLFETKEQAHGAYLKELTV